MAHVSASEGIVTAKAVLKHIGEDIASAGEAKVDWQAPYRPRVHPPESSAPSRASER